MTGLCPALKEGASGLFTVVLAMGTFWGPSGDCDHASFILYLLSLEGFMAQNRYSKLLKKWGPCENSDSYTVIPWYLEQKGQL